MSTRTAAAAHGVDAVIRRLRAIAAGLPPADGVAVFNRMYLTVTQTVRARLDTFADPPAMAVLDTVFARRYLRAVDAVAARRRPPACWRPLFELRAHPGVHPVQFALAGMAAHIQHDLPLAVVDTCRRLGREPEQVEADYHRINDLLAGVEEAVREQLMPGPDLLERFEPLTHRLGAWSVDTARDAAWGSVRVLWELRARPPAAGAFRTALDGAAGLLGRALLLPLGLGDGTAAPGPLPGPLSGPGNGLENGPGRGSGGGPGRGPGAGRSEGTRARTAQPQLECSGLPSA
ncbi:DUF5995 family protein [Kitasatospora sp. NPDC015120]|uniref:DUF5995 family protein n=1 Tax=Kitasatospora sp. NPDC015120 TaxID=3364023 RepID=UPI0036F498D7